MPRTSKKPVRVASPGAHPTMPTPALSFMADHMELYVQCATPSTETPFRADTARLRVMNGCVPQLVLRTFTKFGADDTHEEEVTLHIDGAQLHALADCIKAAADQASARGFFAIPDASPVTL